MRPHYSRHTVFHLHGLYIHHTWRSRHYSRNKPPNCYWLLSNASPSSCLLSNASPSSCLLSNASPSSWLLSNASPSSWLLSNASPSSCLLSNASPSSCLLSNASPSSWLLSNESPSSWLLSNASSSSQFQVKYDRHTNNYNCSIYLYNFQFMHASGQDGPVLCAFAKLLKTTISFVMSVCPSVWDNSAPTGRIFMKFGIWLFFENLSREFKFH
jgi:hypothetical protein